MRSTVSRGGAIVILYKARPIDAAKMIKTAVVMMISLQLFSSFDYLILLKLIKNLKCI